METRDSPSRLIDSRVRSILLWVERKVLIEDTRDVESMSRVGEDVVRINRKVRRVPGAVK
jgi:hypothetical protein